MGVVGLFRRGSPLPRSPIDQWCAFLSHHDQKIWRFLCSPMPSPAAEQGIGGLPLQEQACRYIARHFLFSQLLGNDPIADVTNSVPVVRKARRET